MTHTVKSGDTLSKVAKANGVTLKQLLDANPKFKSKPDLVRVGDVLNIPEGGGAAKPAAKPAPAPKPQPAPKPTPAPAPAPDGAATQPTTPPQPQPSPAHVLGKLSEKFETGGRGAGVVSTGKGDAGGASYGSYQMTSKPGGGTVKRFVSQPDFPFRAKFAGLTPGTAAFTNAWRQLAKTNPDEFQNSQHDFIKKTHFDPLVKKIVDEDKVNVLTRSNALQDVIWSTAVQHGPGTNIPHMALARIKTRPGDPSFDGDFIKAIYAERGKKKADGTLARFSRNSAAVQKGVANRFASEQKDALAMLAKEQGG